MTATTLGDLFPELAAYRPQCPARSPKVPAKSPRGTAQILKSLYPELNGWDPFYVTSAWIYWGRVSGIALSKPDVRDERFPTFLVNAIHSKMLEQETASKRRIRKESVIDAIFRAIQLSQDEVQ
ncbi:hypothetical protein ACI2I2_19950 [Scandinavium sp. NPDC088450]|uniref:hypothetical protein n=1 Tax=Scandinavium sp. NPDC088450 TaxID=3364514 RepID=UPI0038500807